MTYEKAAGKMIDIRTKEEASKREVGRDLI